MDTSQHSEPQPKPSRRWRVLKWGTILLVTAAVLAGGLWMAWLAGANRQVRLATEEARAAGLAVTPAEMLADLEEVPADRDIAPDVLATAALIDTASPAYEAWREHRLGEDDDPSEGRMALLQIERDYVAANPLALIQIRAIDPKIPPATDAARMNSGDWQVAKAQMAAGDAPLMIEVMLPSIAEYREVCNLLAADARVAAHEGDGERAVRDWLRILGMAQALDAAGHSLVELLVAHGLRAAAAEGVRHAVREQPAAVAAAPVELRQALRDQLRALDGPSVWRRGMEADVVMNQDALESLVDGRLPNTTTAFGLPPVATSLGRPILRGDQAQLMRWMVHQASLADAPTLPAYLDRAIPAQEAFDQGSVFDLFADLSASSVELFAESNFRTQADLAAADVALAVAEYMADRDGSLPPALDALVPTYLPSVPRDPMAADAALRYDAARGLLWSVGPNGVDDDASPAVGPGRPGPSGNRGPLDLVYPLTLDAQRQLDAAATTPDSR